MSKKVLCILCVFFIINSANSAPLYFNQNSAGSNSESVEISSASKTEGNTGALEYSYKIKLPSGRNNLTPDINLIYNSQLENNQNIFGFGWAISIPYIERNNKNGIESLYSDENFNTNNFGELVKSTSSGSFVPKKNNSTKTEFINTGNAWEVTDNSGLKYFYGKDENSKIFNASTTNNIHTWYLSDITDNFGNNIHYIYVKDNGYVYPEKITYTNNLNSGMNGIYEIRFNYEDRADNLESYKTGFLIKNNKRLSGVDVYVNGILKKNYLFKYSIGTNGVRSLLSGITETGYSENGRVSALPETIFSYSKPETENSTFTLGNYGFDRIVDINGDGLTDFVLSRVIYTDSYGGYRHQKVEYLNNGDMTFSQNVLVDDASTNSSSFPNSKSLPQTEIPFFLSNSISGNTNSLPIFLLDINDDGFTDVLDSYTSYKGVPFKDVTKISTTTILVGTTTQEIATTTIDRIYATSSLFWVRDDSINLPNSVAGIQPLNLNGDRKPDLKYNHFQQFNGESVKESSLIYLDLNADGLDDKIQVYNMNEPYNSGFRDVQYKNIWINNGLGFTQLDATSTLNYSLPETYKWDMWNSYRVTNNLYADINFDGLTDTITMNGYANINKGTSFVNNTSKVYGSSSGSIFSADLNGDGLPDIASPRNVNGNYNTHDVMLSKMKADLLINIKNNLGGESIFEYAPAVSYKKIDGKLANKIAYPVWTVKSESRKSSNKVESFKNYSYEDAYVLREGNYENTMTGFGKVITVNPNISQTISYYHQGNENSVDEVNDSGNKVGKIYKQEIFNNLNKLEKKEIFEYNNFGLLVNATSTVYDQLNGQSFTTKKGVVYDENLNLIKEINDLKILEISYKNSEIDTKRYLPISKKLSDNIGNVLQKENYFYDNNLDNKITNGLLTQKETYTSSSTKQIEKTVWDTQFGIPVETINTRGATTTIFYDNYKLFPISSTNALGQTNRFSYDYASGKITKSVDANNLETKIEYDGFGRILRNYSNNILLFEKNYNDTYLPSIDTKKYLTETDTVVSSIYFDGFGKTIKEKIENAVGKNTLVEKYYDVFGNLINETFPYEEGSSKIYYKDYVNDLFGRTTEIKTILGIDKVLFGARSKIVYDKNNIPTVFEYGPDGEILKVQESNLGQIYTTNYKYDPSLNLINVTDAENKQRNVTYDWLGRKNTDDGRKFLYGALNEFETETSQTGTAVTTNFDILGRKINQTINEKVATTTFIKIGTTSVATSTIIDVSKILNEFIYDICENGKGRICMSSSSDGVVKKYSYDTFGNINSMETNMNNSVWSPSYKNNFKYDLAGNVLENSDGISTTTYLYEKNYLKNIKYSDNTNKDTIVFSNPTYNFAGQILKYDRADLKTENTYDIDALNRLKNINYFVNVASTTAVTSTTSLGTTTILVATTTVKSFLNSIFEYDQIGRIKSVIKTDGNNNNLKYENILYIYDELSRLLSVDKKFNPTSTTSTRVESFNYSPTGKIISKNNENYLYGLSEKSLPTKIGNNILSWDDDGKLKSATNIGNIVWDQLERIKEINKSGNGSTSLSSKYFYDADGNRILSLIYESGTSTKIKSKLFTPNSNFQNIGSSTSYTISLGAKPIINIDRVEFVGTTTVSTTTFKTIYSTTTKEVVTIGTSTSVFEKIIGQIENVAGASQYDEFKSVAAIPVYAVNDLKDTRNTLNNIRALVGRNPSVFSQRFRFTDLKVGSPQTLTIYFAGSYNDKEFNINFTEGTGTLNSSRFIVPNSALNQNKTYSNNTYTISFVPTTPNITLQIANGSTATHSFNVDAYKVILNTSTTTSKIETVNTVSTSTVSTTTTLNVYVSTTTTKIQTLLTDHLNSIEKVLDFKTLEPVSSSSYSAFGTIYKTGNNTSNRGYTNHQMDTNTNLNYMNARYQSPDFGIFISGDEATKNINANSKLLENPQALNSHSYVWNNPINAHDPDGKLTIIIPGTWYGADWNNTSNPLFMNSMNSFNEIPIVINSKNIWNGLNDNDSRNGAATNISNIINNINLSVNEQINIIGYSHGGNVAKKVTSYINDRVNNLVTLGTPVRSDYQAEHSNINNILNVYSNWDFVQKAGVFGAPTIFNILNYTGKTDFVKNIDVTAYTSNLIDAVKSKAPFRAHGEIWSNSSVWTNEIDKNLSK